MTQFFEKSIIWINHPSAQICVFLRKSALIYFLCAPLRFSAGKFQLFTFCAPLRFSAGKFHVFTFCAPLRILQKNFIYSPSAFLCVFLRKNFNYSPSALLCVFLRKNFMYSPSAYSAEKTIYYILPNLSEFKTPQTNHIFEISITFVSTFKNVNNARYSFV